MRSFSKQVERVLLPLSSAYTYVFTLIDVLLQVQHLTYLKIQNLPKGHVHPKEAIIAEHMKNFEDGKLTRYDYVAALARKCQPFL